MGVMDRAMKWMLSGDTGLSSEAIAKHMLYGECDGSFPWDPSDIGRCFRLIEAVPEWGGRINEMGKYNKQWQRLADHWEEIRVCMEGEVGIRWEKAKSAPKTYALMKRVLAHD